ncbi:MAG: xanthine dehydrogenase family protein subunit M [Ktedonobacterales bacterium]|nr:xanthine dehydrogenase family protein subunit M [Ktedonobacterales bacterium]
MNIFEHTVARSPQEALAALAADGTAMGAARIIAGGTDLLPLMKEGLLAPTQLIDIKPTRELRYIRFEESGEVRIGALTTLADVERDTELAARLPILPWAVREAATPQLRVMATVAGNLLQRTRCWYFRGPFDCWLKGGATCFAQEGENKYQAIFAQSPCVAVNPSDLAPALMALDAVVETMGPGGRRSLAVADLLAPPTADDRREQRLGVDELIVEIRVPAQPEGARGVYLKVMDRQAWAFALVSAAAQMTLRAGRVERVRLVLGSVANVPWRARAAEAMLEGQSFSPELVERAAEAAVEGAAPLAHNGYKLPLARELARRALLAAGER